MWQIHAQFVVVGGGSFRALFPFALYLWQNFRRFIKRTVCSEWKCQKFDAGKEEKREVGRERRGERYRRREGIGWRWKIYCSAKHTIEQAHAPWKQVYTRSTRKMSTPLFSEKC